MRKRILFIGIVITVVAGFLFLQANSSGKQPESVLIFTQVPASVNPVTANKEDLLPDYNGSRIVRLNYENVDKGLKTLTIDFHSAASPSLSFDNEQIVFSGKRNENDPWQIWLMDLDGSDKQKVLESPDNCLAPAFLPNGKIVFSRERHDPNIGVTYSLFTVQDDGSDLNQITFHPHRDFYTSILHDGRIAMVSQQIYPEKKRPVFMVLRPDGTKAQAFYHDKSNSQINSAIRETADGKLIFVQRRENVDEVVSMSYADPGKSLKGIASYPVNGIKSVDILDADRLVVSSQAENNGVFGLYAMNVEGEEELIYIESDYHSVEPVAVRKRRMPRKLPSSISNEKGSGIVISQNVNQSQMEIKGDPETKYIRVEGINRTLDEIALADDGSFYLKVQSDMPIRFQSLDENKEVIRGPSAWIWLRTNERRACVGCHVNKAISPENLVPQAIHDQPVSITDTSRVADASEIQAVRQILNEKETSEFEE